MPRKRGNKPMPEIRPATAPAQSSPKSEISNIHKFNVAFGELAAVAKDMGVFFGLEQEPQKDGTRVLRIKGLTCSTEKTPAGTVRVQWSYPTGAKSTLPPSAFKAGDPVRVNGGDAIIKEVIYSGAGEAPQYKLTDLQGIEFGPAKESELSRR